MDIQTVSLDMMSNGIMPYKTFEGLRDLFDEYNRLDAEVDSLHLMLAEVVQQYNNYDTLIDVQKQQEPVSDLTLEVLTNQQAVILQQLGLAQEAINESLIKMSLLETMIGYVIDTNEEDAEDLELDLDDEDLEDDEEDYEESTEVDGREGWEDLDAEDSEDDEDYEDEEDSEGDEEIWSNEDDSVLLYTLEFNPDMPEHLKVSMSEFIKSCTEMFVEMLISKTDADLEDAEETVVEEETPVQDPNAVVFGADFGKIIGELSVTSPTPAPEVAAEDEAVEPDYTAIYEGVEDDEEETDLEQPLDFGDDIYEDEDQEDEEV